ncbi:MAG: hypothetical protein RLN76_00095 [Phycisphaeraceae bacterium]
MSRFTRLTALLSVSLLSVTGCHTTDHHDTVMVEPEKPAFIEAIELAHGAERYHEHNAVQADFTVDFGGSTIIAGNMVFNTEASKVRMELNDGSTIVFDGFNAWVTPNDAPIQMARFHALTWPYFLAAPMKLSDQGTNLKDIGMAPLDSQNHLAAMKLTFDSSVGDAPDDWYILLKDPDTDALRAMAYIVTYGKSQQEAEESPSLIEYNAFKTIDGVAFATDWTFYHWDAATGKSDTPKGHAKISNIRFVDPRPGSFIRPMKARIDELPEPPAPLAEEAHDHDDEDHVEMHDDAEGHEEHDADENHEEDHNQ